MNKKMFITIASFLIIFGALLFLTYKFTNNNLRNTNWRLNDWSVKEISATYIDITLTFQGNTLGGMGSVNNYGAKYSVLNNMLVIKDIYQTEMASLDPIINEMESTYMELLLKVKYYELNDDTLTLLNSDKEAILTFNKR